MFPPQSPKIQSQSMTEYLDLDLQLPDSWSDSDSEKPLVVHPSVAKPLEKLAQDKQGTFISLSYTFRPGFVFDGLSPDLVLSTADRTLFYVHYEHVLSASSNSFGLFLPPSLCSTGDAPFPAGRIPEHADVLNIILLTIYNMSAVPFFPSFETISSALDAFSRYGFEPKQYACVGQPLYNLILGCEGAQPIDTYALAGAHDLSDVAVAASVHLLSFPLSTLSDELAQRMGAVYLKKLFFRHFGMMNALKRVLMKPPGMHSDTADCSLAQRKCLTRAWALATAHIVWDAGPNLTTHVLQAALSPLTREVNCSRCRSAIRDRIACAVIEWASVERTV